jgi:FMN-dependent oxidoreductase (nitrilotriacetate monooxygenase family)
MTKEIRINAMMADSPYIMSPGIWTHPRDKAINHNTLDYWTDLARLLERGKFDGIFIADTFGVFDVYKGNADASIRHAVRIPSHDPILTIPGMALVTEHICFGVTQNTSYEHPYLLARRLGTLDHLSKGRLAWNIVTGFQESGARAMGLKMMPSSEARYAALNEYMEVVYKLFEGGWEDDAVVKDLATGIFADPAKVHKIQHAGKHLQVEGYHLVEPSPQRTPVLYQAGASGPGRSFAAQHAECVFLIDASYRTLETHVADVRKRAVEFGRNAEDILFFAGFTVISGETEAAAKEKYEDYRRHTNVDAALAFASGSIGLDLSKFDPDEPIPNVVSNAQVRSIMDSYSGHGPGGRAWTPREIALYIAVGGRCPRIVGTPSQVADELERVFAQTDIDGINLTVGTVPGDFEDFVALVVPELQNRGIYKTEYRSGTYREKLFSTGSARLPSRHVGARYRRGAG